jgi:hypothetical protein
VHFLLEQSLCEFVGMVFVQSAVAAQAWLAEIAIFTVAGIAVDAGGEEEEEDEVVETALTQVEEEAR